MITGRIGSLQIFDANIAIALCVEIIIFPVYSLWIKPPRILAFLLAPISSKGKLMFSQQYLRLFNYRGRLTIHTPNLYNTNHQISGTVARTISVARTFSVFRTISVFSSAPVSLVSHCPIVSHSTSTIFYKRWDVCIVTPHPLFLQKMHVAHFILLRFICSSKHNRSSP